MKIILLTLLVSAVGLAQPQPPPGGPPPGGFGGPGGRETPPPPRANRPPMERSLPPGTWWRNPDMVQKLGIYSDQQKKIEDVFQQHRLKLVDLDATLKKEEITLEPLIL